MAKKNRKRVGKFSSDTLSNPSKTLLANIRFAGIDNPIKTIVITSSVMDEGKSTVASNLACAIASSGKRVLLVDADLRRRSLGAMLDLHNANGIYGVLSGRCSLRAAMTVTEIPNLYFMDCEPNVPNPADIFSTRRFAVLMDKLAQTFDYVLFDTPPIGMFVDAAVISNLADGTLMCVRQNATKRDMAGKALQQLQAADANVIGIVMTFVEEKKSDYYYYAYYNEEGKRVRKSHKNQESPLVDGPVTPLATTAEGNIEDWMRAADAAAAQPTRASRSAMRRYEGARAAEADSFAPGAFREAKVDPDSTGQIRSRARHGSRSE